MRTVNKVTLIGNITKDPAIKTTENNKKIALFTIATNRYYKTADGEQKSESEFTNCVSWGGLAEKCEQFLTKGKLVYAEGRLKTRIIDKDDGTKLYKTEVVVSNIIFLNKRSDFETTEVVSSNHDDDKF
ncbi:MAG: single-stranded DNA-binding protein [Candidatus Gracilibacteria bacterium]